LDTSFGSLVVTDFFLVKQKYIHKNKVVISGLFSDGHRKCSIETQVLFKLR